MLNLTELIGFGVASAASPWSFVSAGAKATGTNPSVPVPAGYAAGDLLIIGGAAGTSWGGTIPPTGWTLVINSTVQQRMLFMYKFASSSESSVSLSNSNADAIAAMVCYRNISAVDVAGTENPKSASTSNTTNTLVTTTANDLVVTVCVMNSGGGTITAPAGVTSRVLSSPDGTVRGLLIADENQVAAGTTTTRNTTWTSGAASNSIAVSFKQTV